VRDGSPEGFRVAPGSRAGSHPVRVPEAGRLVGVCERGDPLRLGEVAFAGARLDRAASQRQDPERVAELLADPEAIVIAVGPEGVLLTDEEAPRLAHLAPGEAPEALDPSGAVLLGLQGGHPVLALDLVARPEACPSPDRGERRREVSLREAGALLEARESGLAAYAVALCGWHRSHRFCPFCGAATVNFEVGLARHCMGCGRHHFPRTDPVVIMLVEHEDRVLLGRRPQWPGRRYSVLAGFVAPGETPEQAVIREVEEESGIVAREPRYVAAQPWPFPASLMLAFQARAHGGEPRARDGELADVRWFEKGEVRAAAARRDGEEWYGGGHEEGTGLQLPPRISIARLLIEAWLEH
jgi:NAD+ diphosphatase